MSLSIIWLVKNQCITCSIIHLVNKTGLTWIEILYDGCPSHLKFEGPGDFTGCEHLSSKARNQTEKIHSRYFQDFRGCPHF
jgi:hypothetical protein